MDDPHYIHVPSGKVLVSICGRKRASKRQLRRGQVGGSLEVSISIGGSNGSVELDRIRGVTRGGERLLALAVSGRGSRMKNRHSNLILEEE